VLFGVAVKVLGPVLVFVRVVRDVVVVVVVVVVDAVLNPNVVLEVVFEEENRDVFEVNGFETLVLPKVVCGVVVCSVDCAGVDTFGLLNNELVVPNELVAVVGFDVAVLTVPNPLDDLNPKPVLFIPVELLVLFPNNEFD
jgi:hypothetical protein